MDEELERCLADARVCADACEAYLGGLPEGSAELRDAVDALAAPAAVARTLDELADQPRPLALAAARLLHELAAGAVDRVDGRSELADALRAVADSTARLLATAE
ncbi:MAG TPA: hypothetical protein VFL60_07240 [Gaiellaceae bacterium]|nr:hypothetical protein [Gaiellaceae bacterium]